MNLKENIVTELKSTRDELRVSIYVDGKFKFAVENQLIEQYSIKIGTKLEESVIKKLSEDDLRWKLLRKAEAKMFTRPYAKFEIANYLRRALYRFKQYSDVDQTGAVEWVLDRMEDNGALDDKAYTEWIVGIKSERKSKSELRRLLMSKKVDSSIITEVLDITEVNEASQIDNLVQKQIDIYKGRKTRQEIEKKVLASLMRKGYKYNEIKSAITSKLDSNE